MTPPAWLPDLITLSAFDGKWNPYVEAVYDVFRRDFVASQPLLNGVNVGVRRQPSYDQKEFTFWHCVSEGRVEADRIPDIRRCERIPWMRPIIEHDTEVDVWEGRKNGDDRLYLWFNEQYLVVLGVRTGHYMLITAFLTDRRHTQDKLRRERDATRP